MKPFAETAVLIACGSLLFASRVRALDLDFVPVGLYAKAPGGAVEKILVSGKHAFVAQLPELEPNTGVVRRGGGLHVVNIAEPDRPRPISRYSTGIILDFAIDGTTLVLLEQPHVQSGGGLHIIDIGDPAKLRREGFFPRSGGYQDRPLAAFGNHVYFMENNQSVTTLSVIDISDKSNPRRVGAYTPKWKTWPTFLLPAVDYLYVAEGTDIHVLDVSNPSAPRTISDYAVGGTIMAATLADGRLYLAQRSVQDFSPSFSIVDVTVPANPSRIGHLSSGGVFQPVAVAIHREHAYLLELDGNYRDWRKGALRVIDVGISSEPKPVGAYQTIGVFETDRDTRFPMGAIGLALADDFALLGDSGGFSTLALSSPAEPILASRHTMRSDVRDMAVSGKYSYVADGFAGLDIVNVSDASDPRLEGNYFMSAPANSVTLAGNIAYVAAHGGLHLVDVSTASNPKMISSWLVAGDVQKAIINGNYSFVPVMPAFGGGGGGLHILDTTNPASPRWLGSYGTVARAVSVAGNYAYVVVPLENNPPRRGEVNVAEELHVVDITNPRSPERKMAISTPAQSLISSDNFLYVAGSAEIIPFGLAGSVSYQTGFGVFDITDPALPSPLGDYWHSGDRHARDIVVSGSVAFATDHTWTCGHGCFFLGATVRAIDIADANNPQLVGSYRLPDYAEEFPIRSDLGVAASGSLVFVAGGGSGLHVLNATPSNPQRAGIYKSPSLVLRATLADSQAFLVDDSRLEVIDISTGSIPRPVAVYNAERPIVTVADSTNRTLLLEAGSVLINQFQEPVTYLEILDISNSSSPVVKGTYSTPGQAVDVAAAGPFAYLLMSNFRDGARILPGVLEIVDLSDPAAARGVGRYTLNMGPVAFTIAETYAYIVGQEGHLEIVDLSVASSPQTVGRLFASGVLVDVAVSGRYAYVAEQPRWGDLGWTGGGLLVVDIGEPSNPNFLGKCVDGVYARGAAVLGNYVYLLQGDSNGGTVHVIDARDPKNPRRVGENTIDAGYLGSIGVARDKVFVAAGELGLLMLHAYRPISFENVTTGLNGAINMRITGPPGVPGLLQSSADLHNWQDVKPISFGENALDISSVADGFARFYRVTTEPR